MRASPVLTKPEPTSRKKFPAKSFAGKKFTGRNFPKAGEFSGPISEISDGAEILRKGKSFPFLTVTRATVVIAHKSLIYRSGKSRHI